MSVRQFGQGDTFTISRDDFNRAFAACRVAIEHERIGHYDRHDWSGRHYRHFAHIGAVRWDNGDPGDENDGD